MTPAVRRLVTVLAVTAFVEWLGAGAVLPLLPTFLRDRGASPSLVGLVMAAYFIAGLVTQYPAGYLCDRIGQRRVLTGGLLFYAAGSLGFLTSPGNGGYVVLRAVQGAGAGTVEVAALSLVGVAVPSEFRGRAFSMVFAGQLGGLAIGPLAGSIAGIDGMPWLFTATAITSTIAGVIVLAALPDIRAGGQVEHVRLQRLRLGPMATGVMITGIIGGLTTGVYETTWSLLLNSRGATTWQIGLSWTLFAAPFAAFSPVAGRMADRLDRRWLALLALAWSAGFAAVYPFLTSTELLIGLGAAEAIGVAIAYPAAQSLLADSTPAETLGRAQGLLTAIQTGAMAIGAGAGGALFGEARWAPYDGSAAISVLLIAAIVPLWWRSPGVSRPPTGGAAADGVADTSIALEPPARDRS